MNRRELIATGVAASGTVLAVGALSSQAFAATDKVTEATAHCIAVGQACAQHCVEMIEKGNKDMIVCLKSVNAMLATCEAMQRLTAAKSKHAAAQAKVCMETLADCADTCEKHSKMAACKECSDACKACMTACKSVA
jgi:Cys-rich four helix bundle protein (predicted Tat secretion target)